MDSVHHEDETVVMQFDTNGIDESSANDHRIQHTIPESATKGKAISEGPWNKDIWNKDIWNRDIGSNNNQDQLGSRQQEEGRSHNSER